jgi:hypothetical protein
MAYQTCFFNEVANNQFISSTIYRQTKSSFSVPFRRSLRVFDWSSDGGDGVLKADGSLIEWMDESGDVRVSIARLGLVELHKSTVIDVVDAYLTMLTTDC